MPGSRYPRPAAAWYAVAVLFLAYTFSAIDRQILTLLVGPVRADLVLSDFELSLLQGAAFSLLFVFVGFPVGRLADVHSRRGIIACGIAFWCLMTTACGLSRNFLQLFLARMGVGVGEATLSPAASSLIADMFPPEKRAVAFSVYHLGYPVGGGLALVIGGLILESLDGIDVLTLGWLGEFRAWQVAFILVGLPGLLLVPLMFSFRDPVRQARLHGVHGESVPLSTVWGFVRRRWQAFGAHLSAVSFLGMLAIGTAIWYPTFLIRTYGMSPSDAGYSYGLVMGLCGAAGILCGLGQRLVCRAGACRRQHACDADRRRQQDDSADHRTADAHCAAGARVHGAGDLSRAGLGRRDHGGADGDRAQRDARADARGHAVLGEHPRSRRGREPDRRDHRFRFRRRCGAALLDRAGLGGDRAHDRCDPVAGPAALPRLRAGSPRLGWLIREESVPITQRGN